MKISEVLHDAADKYLWRGYGPETKSPYTCVAILEPYTAAAREALDFVDALGVPRRSLCAFDEFKHGPERQGARYLWLKFAALVAESEGL